MNAQRDLVIVGAAEHNLKHIDVRIPRGALTVITGISGSGKSSLAFDTIYAEGQRRYVESLSAYARQFLDQMPKPHVEHIEGLSPAISIEQKTTARNPRSTVGTVTEIYDYLRVLYSGIGRPHCPECGESLERQTVQDIVDMVLALAPGTRVLVLAPVVRGRKGEYQKIFEQAVKEGFVRGKVDGAIIEIDPAMRLKKQFKHDISIVIDRLVIGPDLHRRLTDSVELALKKADGLVTIDVLAGENAPKRPPREHWVGERTFSETMSCPRHGPQLLELSPRMFSFNSPYGACPRCKGLGMLQEVDPERVLPDPTLSLRQGAIVPWRNYFLTHTGRPKEEEEGAFWGLQFLKSLCQALEVDFDTPWNRLTARQQKILLHGTGGEKIPVRIEKGRARFEHEMAFEGIVPRIERRLRETASEGAREYYMQYIGNRPCIECGGARLRAESRAVTLGDCSIADVCRMSIGQARRFFDTLELTSRERQIAQQPLKQITDRLGFLLNVGLNYLTLDRAAGSLSGGEAQRIRLATQIGSQLTGVLYVLDEPSIGLHQKDNARLIQTLQTLRDLGNTVIVVEHDEQTIRAADWVVDLGPGAGRLGGEVVAAGTPAEIQAAPQSITGHFLSGTDRIALPAGRRAPQNGKFLRLLGCAEHNLKGINVEFPLGMMIGVTGVSGSGKSSLVVDTLWPALANYYYRSNLSVGAHKAIEGLDALDKVIDVDQSPIGRTPRSNPATYTKTMDLIRDLFAQLPDSRVRGYSSGRFSFNVKGGRCESCCGDGLIKVEMHFLPDVYVECEACRGRRFNRETLEVRYKGKSIADVLEMTVEEAVEFFDAIPMLKRKLETLNDVGLGYITLGQSATTLSGGEAQRVKLTRELSKKNTGRTLYILDEPTTGLHFADVKKLIEVLNRLVDAGSTVIIIEHNLDVIKSCDWLIDLGPEGGDEGGCILATGTPEQVAACENSHTAKYLRALFNGGSAASAPSRSAKSRRKK